VPQHVVSGYHSVLSHMSNIEISESASVVHH